MGLNRSRNHRIESHSACWSSFRLIVSAPGCTKPFSGSRPPVPFETEDCLHLQTLQKLFRTPCRPFNAAGSISRDRPSSFLARHTDSRRAFFPLILLFQSDFVFFFSLLWLAGLPGAHPSVGLRFFGLSRHTGSYVPFVTVCTRGSTSFVPVRPIAPRLALGSTAEKPLFVEYLPSS